MSAIISDREQERYYRPENFGFEKDEVEPTIEDYEDVESIDLAARELEYIQSIEKELQFQELLVNFML